LQHQYGYTLTEILVSLCLLSLLVLGLNAAQVMSVRATRAAYHLSVAELQLYSMAERLSILHGNQLDESITEWNNQNSVVLPQGKGEVEGLFPDYHLSIHWGKSDTSSCDQVSIGESGCLEFPYHVSTV
jgi:type II secretory pathway component PulJ